MIPSDRLQLVEFSEEHVDGALETAKVRVQDVETTRAWTATATRTGDGVVLKRFNDSATTCLEREAFGALWYCIEEFHARDIYPDLGPFGDRAGHTAVDRERSMTLEEATDTTTDAETPVADGEAPQPTAALSDGGATPAIRKAPGTLEPVSTETWCGICGEGPFENLAIHHGRLHDGDVQPVSTQPTGDPGASTDTPEWLAGDPHDVVADAPVHRTLSEVIEAVVQQEDVLNIMRRLGMTRADGTRDLLQQLGLLGTDGQPLEGPDLDERLAVLSEWIDDGE